MKVGIIQFTSVLDYKLNLLTIEKYLQKAKDLEVEAIFLPECFYSMSDGVTPTPYLVSSKNEHYKNIQKLATDYKIYILGGSAATIIDDQKIVNRVYNFSPDGIDLGLYDKMHLFSCDINKNGKRKKINEGDIYTKGENQKILEFEGFKIGLGVCVDLRFSDFSHQYKKNKTHILTYASAFTVPTGKAHWHILLRARAIENQCYVIAPAQWGKHNDKIQTFGHSLIIDPWGEILADAKEGEKLITAEINLEKINEVEKTVIMN